MFQKPFRVKSNTTIKGSDRKRWKTQIEERFPTLSAADVADLMPSKGEITVAKLFTHSGSVVNVLCVLKNPLFFEIDGAIFPTVYLLWRHPDVLPTFTTWPNVIPKLCGGADLMLPGVILPNGNSFGPRSFGNLQRGDPCSVNQIINKAPIAVGKTALSSDDMFLSGKRGKGVIVLHIYNDQLWALGEKTVIPDLPPPFELSTSRVEDTDTDDESYDDKPSSDAADKAQDANCCEALPTEAMCSPLVDVGNSNVLSNDFLAENVTEDCESVDVRDVVSPPSLYVSELQFESMDSLLLYCFLKAWKTSAKKVELPLLTSTFYKAYMLPSVPKGHTMDVKKSSYKKLSKFLQEMQDRGLVQLQELSKGVQSIVGVNPVHPELKSFSVGKGDAIAAETEVAHEEPKRPYEPPEIVEIFLVNAAVLPLFKLFNHGKGAPSTGPEVKQILQNYIKENNLQNSEQKSIVNLDPVLGHVLLVKNENNVIHLKWDEIQSRCLKKMTPGYRVTFAGQEPTVHKGEIASIELSIATRAANKKVTLITNLETFGIDSQEFAHTVQIGVATSTSVSPAPNKKDGCQVLIQGNQVKFVAKLLLDEYKIPRRYIKGLELASKKGKK